MHGHSFTPGVRFLANFDEFADLARAWCLKVFHSNVRDLESLWWGRCRRGLRGETDQVGDALRRQGLDPFLSKGAILTWAGGGGQ